jgi:1-acyl-sn-glycerol-3-phosphate acyltransferase
VASLCKAVLENAGNVLVIYPEGTRSTTGEVGEFRPGISLLLAGSELPVVPCYLDGAFRAWPKGARFPRPRKVRLLIGQPRSYATLSRGKEAAEVICRDLREAVLALAQRNE